MSSLVLLNFIIIIISTLETLDITPESINRTPEKIGPDCFELLKVLGKGGYGKVRIERESDRKRIHILSLLGFSSSEEDWEG